MSKMSSPSNSNRLQPARLHPRNRHQGRYDFKLLMECSPELAPYLLISSASDSTIDFSNPEAVKLLNRALLRQFYGIAHWDIPKGYLCPPIPGRADYLHHLADLLSNYHNRTIPRGASVRVLDIGVGANLIYPIIGNSEYGWHFVGSDIDPIALDSARKIADSNQKLASTVEIRQQHSPNHIFKGLLKGCEVFDLSLCNPPFHASLEEAQQGSRRKWKNLGFKNRPKKVPQLNFGGQESELWCAGGEADFVKKMIEESCEIPTQIFWFSTLIAKEIHLPRIYHLLKKAGVQETRTIPMSQGQKKSRIVAWTFFTKQQIQRHLNPG